MHLVALLYKICKLTFTSSSKNSIYRASVHIYATFTKSASVSVQLHDTPNVGPSYWGDVIYYDVYINIIIEFYIFRKT